RHDGGVAACEWSDCAGCGYVCGSAVGDDRGGGAYDGAAYSVGGRVSRGPGCCGGGEDFGVDREVGSVLSGDQWFVAGEEYCPGFAGAWDRPGDVDGKPACGGVWRVLSGCGGA